MNKKPASPSSVVAIDSRLAANQRRRQRFPLQEARLVRLVRLLHKLFNDQANALLRTHGLTHAEYNVLITLDSSEQGLGPSELAEATCEKASNTTRLVDQLITKGWVTREASAEDRRRFCVRLTVGGEQLIEQVLPAVSAQLNGFLAELDDTECGQLEQLLRKVIGGVEDGAL